MGKQSPNTDMHEDRKAALWRRGLELKEKRTNLIKTCDCFLLYFNLKQMLWYKHILQKKKKS